MPVKDPALLRTQFSIQAQDFAKTFNASFGRTRLAPADYAPELTAPEGPSTGGGVQSLERIRLVPGKPGFPTLVVGGVNQKEGTAEVRSFEHVNAIHQERFQRPVALDPTGYTQFIGAVVSFLGVSRIRAEVTGAPAGQALDPLSNTGERAPSTSGGSSSSAPIVIGIIIAAVVIAAVVLWLFVFRR